MEILKRFEMLDYKAVATSMASNLKLLCDASSESIVAMMYCQMIGSLMYLMNTGPNICFDVNNLSQFEMNPRHVHLVSTKHEGRYLKDKVEYGLKYDMNEKTSLHSYVDSDWVGSTTKRKSTLGFFFNLISNMIY